MKASQIKVYLKYNVLMLSIEVKGVQKQTRQSDDLINIIQASKN